MSFGALCFIAVSFMFAGFFGGYALGETCKGNELQKFYERKLRAMEKRLTKRIQGVKDVDGRN